MNRGVFSCKVMLTRWVREIHTGLHDKIFFAAGAVSVFIGIAIGVFALVRSGAIEPGLGILMLICLLGMYVGFGILIAVYRLVNKLQ